MISKDTEYSRAGNQLQIYLDFLQRSAGQWEILLEQAADLGIQDANICPEIRRLAGQAGKISGKLADTEDRLVEIFREFLQAVEEGDRI